jgi:hypothetical protein
MAVLKISLSLLLCFLLLSCSIRESKTTEQSNALQSQPNVNSAQHPTSGTPQTTQPAAMDQTASGNDQSNPEHPDKVYGRGSSQGKVLSFNMGDYLHVNFGNEKNKSDYWLMNGEIAYYLASHKAQTISIKYVDADVWLPEPSAYQRMKWINDANTTEDTFDLWYAKVAKDSLSYRKLTDQLDTQIQGSGAQQ